VTAKAPDLCINIYINTMSLGLNQSSVTPSTHDQDANKANVILAYSLATNIRDQTEGKII